MAKATKIPRTKKTAPTIDAEPEDQVTELHAEEIGEIPEGTHALVPAEVQAKTEIAKFNLQRAWIANKKEQYKGLFISGVDDKEGEKRVLEAWREIRNKRLAVDKTHKAIKADYLFVARAIDGEKNDLTELLREIEDPLKAEMDRIEAIRQEEKDRVIREAEQKLHSRVTTLLEAGMKFDGSFYSIAETISVDVVTLKAMEDERFEGLLAAVSAKKTELEEVERKRLEEEEAEKQRIEEQRLENERKEKQLEEEREQLRKDLREAREEKLLALGFKSVSGHYLFELGKYFIEFPFVDLADMDRDVFEEHLSHARNYIITSEKEHEEDLKREEDERLKREEEDRKKQEADRIVSLRVQRLQDMFGIIYQVDDHEVLRRVPEYDGVPEMTVKHSDIVSMPEENWLAYLEALNVEYGEVKERIMMAEKAIFEQEENERKAAMNDAERIREWLKDVSSIMSRMPETNDKRIRPAVKTFDRNVSSSMNDLLMVIEKIEQ